MSLNLTILGCNSAIPSLSRFTTSQILSSDCNSYVIDCGEGIQIRMSDLKIKRGKISEIFISHLHGDHFFGLPGLLTSFNLSGRTQKLSIFGPKGLNQFVQTLKDIGSFYLNFELEIKELDDQNYSLIFENEEITVFSIPLKHRIPTTGFLFREKERELNIIPEKILDFNLSIEEIKMLKAGQNVIRNDQTILNFENFTERKYNPKSYAFCSDTIYDESLVKYLENVDLLYHEATYLDNMKEKAHERMHATASEAATIAKKANAKHLLLGHFSSRYKDTSTFLAEAKTIFENVTLAHDGLVIKI